jgi:uncharacterized protein
MYTNEVRTSFFALALLLALAGTAIAQEFAPPTPTGFVNDYAKVVDSASAARMETMARNFRDRTNIDVAVVTLPSLQGRPIEEAGLQIGRQWGIGAGEEKNGLLVLIAIEERKSRIEVSRHLEDEITDGTAGSILRRARPQFQESKYGEGLQLILESVLATIAQKQGISIEGIDASRAVRAVEEPQQQSKGTSIVSIIVVVVILFVLFNFFRNSGGGGGGRGGRRGRRWGGGMPIIIPGGWGGGGGGGSWSGGGGGDSWGGFGGGGDFGGGGASSDW